MQKWQTTNSKTLINDKWLKLRADTCVTPAGSKVDTYYVMEPGDWANCVVIDADHKLIMVRHYRHPINNPGLQTNKVYSFLAIGGACSQEPKLEAGETLSVEKIPLAELIESIENPQPGVIYQAIHITSLYAALSFIKKSSLSNLVFPT